MKLVQYVYVGVIVLGIVLRLYALDYVDLFTDEAQFMLGARSHPPLVLSFIQASFTLFGYSITAARGVSALFGIATIGLMGLYMKDIYQRGALLAMALIAVFPPSILLSKLIYLDTVQMFFWLLLIYCYQKALKNTNTLTVTSVCIVALASYFAKVQGLLLPGSLLIVHCLVHLRTFWKQPLTWALVLAGIPAALYLVSVPEILGIIVHYRTNFIGLYEPTQRLVGTMQNWWIMLGPFLLLFVLIGTNIKRIHFGIWLTIGIAVCINFVLSPRLYYMPYMAVSIIPITLWLHSKKPLLALGTVTALSFWSIALFVPQLQSPIVHPIVQAEPYWNNNKAILNSQIPPNEPIAALGTYGHEVRWYIAAPIVKANDFTNEQLQEYSTLLVMQNHEADIPSSFTPVYTDSVLQIFTRPSL